jgi:flagellar hook-associated protein 2
VSLSLQSQTQGSAGNLTVTSSLLDTTNTSTKEIAYTNSSDISGLANLGITVSQNYDGSLDFDASVLDTALNSDFNSVAGFFQNVNSWGQSFAKTLNSAGNSSSTGGIALAQTANSSTESTLNAEVSKQESLISIQQKNLTAELNSANEILQGLKSQLDGINMLYSAISGYKGQ